MAEEQSFSTPPAKKVKQGSFSPGELTLETTGMETVRIPWEKIKFGILGKIHEVSSAPSTPTRKAPDIRPGRVIGALIAGPLGTGAYDLVHAKKETPSTPKNENFLIFYLYVADEVHPYRFDSLGTNFKTFLNEETGYSGELNLFLFIRKISPFMLNALDSGITAFLEKGKNYIPAFSSRDEFSWHCEETYRKRTRLK